MALDTTLTHLGKALPHAQKLELKLKEGSTVAFDEEGTVLSGMLPSGFLSQQLLCTDLVERSFGGGVVVNLNQDGKVSRAYHDEERSEWSFDPFFPFGFRSHLKTERIYDYLDRSLSR